MEKDNYQDELEELIKQKADQFRIYPSERVWSEVNKRLHPPIKWYRYGIALFLFMISGFLLHELTAPPTFIPAATSIASSTKAPIIIYDFSKLISVKGTNSFFKVSSAKAASTIPFVALISTEPAVKRSRQGLALKTAEQIKEPTTEAPNLLYQLAPHPIAPSIPPFSILDKKQQEEIPEQFKRVNWLQDQLLNNIAARQWKRMSFQISVAPTMNFRVLKGRSNAILPSNIRNVPIALSIPGEVNRLVNHKPALGFELGTHAFYAVNSRISLKAGIQFNYSRYSIKAFNAPMQLTSIALTSNTLNGNSIQTLSSLNNFGGYNERSFQNQYFQLSAPFGAEMRVLGKRRLQLVVGATLQPTYLLNRSTYLITNDYKSYTQQPSLIRRWNVNTSAEAFLSYKTGGLRWQLGPQFRYQLMSSYIKEYPISEYLLEYGIKVGVTKTLR